MKPWRASLAIGVAVAVLGAGSAASAADTARKKAASEKPSSNLEVQLEYLDARFFEKRDVNTYNVHFFQVASNHGALTIHRGLTVTRALGYTSEYGYPEDSNAVGIGPAIMLRWKQPVSGKLSAAWDASGSLMFYNRAHPAHGRAYGFLWRTGPRLIWDYDDSNSVSVGWSFAHSSNGMGTHNPGYNGVGFSLGFNHKF
ncbi:MAG: acyloxyacyl hydrolase [Schwartzia sp.]|nr:acyloxyacyl hydrolase [Schwartzia sp. (in: firmicutes)]